jgi:hypothetical protein
MTLADAYQIVGMVGVVFTVGGAVWSRRAAKLSAPTGNGFAKTVVSALIRIESRQDTMDQRLERLETSRADT